MTRPLHACLFILATTFYSAFSWATSGPTDEVKTTIDKVLTILADASLDESSKRSRVIETITSQFNFTGMSQRILATNWKNASEGQRARFIALFSQILANTYWVRIRDYRDEKVEYLGEKVVDDRLARVRTQILTQTAKVPIDYSLEKQEDGWRAYDVTIEGVSLIQTYRTTYQQIAKQAGIDGLLAKMEEKLSEPPAQ